jgi:hypothetical protein
MWYNGIRSVNNKYFTVIIWKDYNCLGYISLESQGSSGPSTDLKTIGSVVQNNPSNYDDIWKAAMDISEGVEKSLTGKAYTVVVSQAKEAYFLGRCCIGAYTGIRYVYYDATYGSWGSVLVMQMR